MSVLGQEAGWLGTVGCAEITRDEHHNGKAIEGSRVENDGHSSHLRLSFCIATYNRAAFLAETLEALVSQISDACEIIVTDNASQDNTEQVICEYMPRFSRLRYFKQDTNVGPDRNFDRAVMLAQGEFCWLMADDDTLKPGAVARVIESLSPELSLIVANMEFRDITMSRVISRRWINIRADRTYEPGDMDRLFIEFGDRMGSAGNLILRRSIWLSRQRERYYGSLFIHTGVLFQEALPGRVLIIAEPLINYRTGNNERWFCDSTEIFLEKWPSVVDSLQLSESTKKQVDVAHRWTRFRTLLALRSRGYSFVEYSRWIRPRVTSSYDAAISLIVAILPRIVAYSLTRSMAFIRRNLEQLLYLFEQRHRAAQRSERRP